MSENPYHSPEGQSNGRRALPSFAARVWSMLFICIGAGFGTLAAFIIEEIIRLRIPGLISIFEEPPVPSWMALICLTLATTFIGIGILIRRRSSRKRTAELEQS